MNKDLTDRLKYQHSAINKLKVVLANSMKRSMTYEVD